MGNTLIQPCSLACFPNASNDIEALAREMNISPRSSLAGDSREGSLSRDIRDAGLPGTMRSPVNESSGGVLNGAKDAFAAVAAAEARVQSPVQVAERAPSLTGSLGEDAAPVAVVALGDKPKSLECAPPHRAARPTPMTPLLPAAAPEPESPPSPAATALRARLGSLHDEARQLAEASRLELAACVAGSTAYVGQAESASGGGSGAAVAALGAGTYAALVRHGIESVRDLLDDSLLGSGGGSGGG